MSTCQYGAEVMCQREATMAVRTTTPQAFGLVTTVYWDASDAPGTAQRLCAQHGATLLSDLAHALA